MKVVSFMNQKGGVGKTTTAFHFAVYQAKKGKKVLCIDLDPQGSLTYCLGAVATNENTVFELMMGEATFKETVQKTQYCDVIPSDNILSIFSHKLEKRDDKFLLLSNSLKNELNNYDYVIIDCPPGITLNNLNALSVSTNVVVITQAEALSLLGLPQVFNLIKNAETLYKKNIKIAGILITMFNGYLKVSRELKDLVKNIVEEYDMLSYNTLIKKLTAIQEATMKKTSVFDYAPNSQGAHLYLEACEEIEQSLM